MSRRGRTICLGIIAFGMLIVLGPATVRAGDPPADGADASTKGQDSGAKSPAFPPPTEYFGEPPLNGCLGNPTAVPTRQNIGTPS